MATSVVQPIRKQKPESEAVLPKPPAFSCKPEKFLAYWASLFPKYKDQVTVYIYRMWPVINREKNSKKKYIDILTEPLSREDMAHRYGDGDYAMHLTNGSREICRTRMHGRDGIRDYAPPVIDVQDLVMDDPANSTYIEALRAKGILPREKGEDDVATVQAVSTMTDTMLQMVGKVLDKNTAQTSAEQTATAKSIELISNSANKVIEMVKDQAAANSNPDQGVALLDKVAAVAERFAARDSGSGLKDVLPLVQLALEQSKGSSETQLKFLADRLQFTESLLLAQKESRSGAPSDIDRLIELKEVMQSLFPQPNPQPEESSFTKHLPLVVSGLGILGAIVYNLVVAKTGNGTPIPPDPTAQLAAAVTGADPTRQPIQEGTDVYKAFLREIETPLLNSLRAGEPGGKFARFLIQLKGEHLFGEIQKAGRDQLIALLQMHDTLFAQLNADPRFPQFVDEFLAGPVKE